MVKTIRKYKLGEEPEVDFWEREYSPQQRLNIATELVEQLWSFANNAKPFPRLDRSIVKIIRPENNKSCIGAHLQ